MRQQWLYTWCHCCCWLAIVIAWSAGFLSSIFGLLAKDAADIVYLVLSAIKQKVCLKL